MCVCGGQALRRTKGQTGGMVKATTKERRVDKVLSGYLRCCRVDLIGICGLRGHKTGRQARDEGGRLNNTDARPDLAVYDMNGLTYD